MKDELTIALLQVPLVWENSQENLNNLELLINNLEAVDLVILPEMFTTGFTMHPEKLAETMDGSAISKLKEWSRKINSAITGSLVIKENDNFYNRLVFVKPNGEIESYDKRHLFSLAGEDKVFAPGKNKLIVEHLGWKICPMICYDLRFPVWSRNQENYDLLLYVANWPAKRIQAWDALLQARAIENMCYSVGVNRVGVDDNGFEYPGHSSVYDVLGNQLVISEKKEVILQKLHKGHIDHYREKLQFLGDKDSFTVLT